MLLREIMNKNFSVLNKQDPLSQALLIMKKTKSEGIPVVEEDHRLIGYLSRSRLYKALLSGANLSEEVSNYMLKKTCVLNDCLTFDETKALVREATVGSAPVVDKDKRVVGLFDKLGLLRHLLHDSDRLNGELQAVLNGLHSGLLTIDENGIIIFANEKAQTVLELTSQRLVGERITEIWPDLGVQDSKTICSPVIGLKMRFEHTYLMVNLIPIITAQKTCGLNISFQDLTELESVKQLQDTLATILEITYNGIIVVNQNGLISHANHSFLEFTGQTMKELQGVHIHKIFPKCRLPVIAQTGVPETSDILYIRNTPFVVSGLPIIQEGLITGAVGMIHFANNRETVELVSKLAALQKKVEYYRGELQKTKSKLFGFDEIITRNSRLKSIKEEARKFAFTNSTILIMGESGTGKELFAQAIHLTSHRWKKPIIKVNCAAIPENLLESELFGYAPGAFTGAVNTGKPGRFELASGGTLFLDEIGDMPLALQAKILRAIETCQFERVGGIETIKVDVRIIAATNKNLGKSVEQGTFREDLYYRLNVMEIWLPPLRERREDIAFLIESFINKFNSMFGTQVEGTDYEVTSLLSNYRWPGNIRELENCIERGVQLARSGSLKLEHLPHHIVSGFSKFKEVAEETPLNYQQKKGSAERQIIIDALLKSKGNKVQAAKILGMSRSSLYEKMKKLGII